MLDALAGGLLPDGTVITGSELALYLQRRVASHPGPRQMLDFGAFAFDDRGELALTVQAASSREDLPSPCWPASASSRDRA
jgi:hypothetical protein